MKEYIVTVDVARKRDYFNIHVSKITPEIMEGSAIMDTPDKILHWLDILHIEKYQNLDYEDMVTRVEVLCGEATVINNHSLLVDGTGTGDVVVEMLRKRKLNPLPIIFVSGGTMREVRTGGASAFPLSRGQGGELNRLSVVEEVHVPKVDLVEAGKYLLQRKRVRVAPGLRWGDDFKKQLNGFRGRVNETTNRVKYEAETEGLHDDQVVCYLMSAWYLQRLTRQVVAYDGMLIRPEVALASHRPYLEEDE